VGSHYLNIFSHETRDLVSFGDSSFGRAMRILGKGGGDQNARV